MQYVKFKNAEDGGRKGIEMKFIIVAVSFLLPLAGHSQASRNGEFTAATERIGGAKSHPEFNTWNASIRNRAGDVRYRIVREVPFDSPYPSIALFNNGGAVVENAFYGTLDFYDSRGNLLRTVLPFGTATAEHEQIIKVSTAGSRAAVLVSSPHRDAAVLTMYDEEGSELWRNTLDGIHAAEVFLSSDAGVIAAGAYTMKESVESYTHVFDGQGKSLMQVPGYFRCADVSQSHIVLGDRNSVRSFAIGNPSPHFSWASVSPAHIVTDVRIAGSLVVCSVEKIEIIGGVPTYINPSLVVLDSFGSIVARRELSSASVSPVELMITGATANLSAEGGSTSLPLELR